MKIIEEIQKRTNNRFLKEFIFNQKCIPWRIRKIIQNQMKITHLNGQIVKDYSEFSATPINRVLKNICNYCELVKRDYSAILYNDFEIKTSEFYKTSKYYIYDLLSNNYNKQAIVNKLNKFSPLILKSIKEHPGKKFLEFGGGLGLFCQIASEIGKDVTYLDIPGNVSDFAIWRFKKYKLPIDIIITDPLSFSGLENNYDIIFSDAVIEHLINQEATVDTLCKHINGLGILILLIDIR